MKSYGYPKQERLKSRKVIGALFTEGQSVSKYPLRLVYTFSDTEDCKIGVSVSKRFFKKAVDRNYYKRVLRECYRLNKQYVKQLPKPINGMIFYQTSARLPYAEVLEKMKQLLEKLPVENSK